MASLEALALSDALTALVRAKGGRDPAGLMRRLCLFAAQIDAWSQPHLEALLGDVFLGIVTETSADQLAPLGAALAEADWAAPQLVRLLAQEDIEIARPLIARSPALDEKARIVLLRNGAIEHRIEVARGPGLGAEAIAAVIALGEPMVLAALADNLAAPLTPADLLRLAGIAQQVSAVRAPLARHPQLTPEAGRILHGWVEAPLRAALAARFGIGGDPAEEGPVEDEADQLETERRLVAKLKGAGQLRPSYLLRALREGRLSLFAAALACLADCPLPPLRAAVMRADAEILAIACAAVGIDRSVFPTVLGLARDLAGGRDTGPALAYPACILPPEAAADLLRERLSTV